MYKWRERPAFTPRCEIVAGLLAPGELCLLTGAPGSGKSTVAVALACAVLNGTPFLGRACARGAVAYLATVRGQALPRRLEAAGVGEDVALAILPRPFSLVARTELAEVVEEIRKCVGLPRLIVIDTLEKSIPGIEENSAKERRANSPSPFPAVILCRMQRPRWLWIMSRGRSRKSSRAFLRGSRGTGWIGA